MFKMNFVVRALDLLRLESVLVIITMIVVDKSYI